VFLLLLLYVGIVCFYCCVVCMYRMFVLNHNSVGVARGVNPPPPANCFLDPQHSIHLSDYVLGVSFIQQPDDLHCFERTSNNQKLQPQLYLFHNLNPESRATGNSLFESENSHPVLWEVAKNSRFLKLNYYAYYSSRNCVIIAPIFLTRVKHTNTRSILHV